MNDVSVPDFDFLSYLDASLVDSGSGGGGSSSTGTWSGESSPHDGSFSGSHTQYAATSPSSSFTRSPLFGSSNGTGAVGYQQQYQQPFPQALHQQQQQPSPTFGIFDFSSLPESSYANSPPFDTSIFANLQAHQPSLKPESSFNFVQGAGNLQSDYWTQAYLQQPIQGPTAHASHPQVSEQFLSPKSIPQQTPSLSSNSNSGSPASETMFDPAVARVKPERRFSAQFEASAQAPLSANVGSAFTPKLPPLPEQHASGSMSGADSRNGLQAGKVQIPLVPASTVQHVPTVNKIAKTNLKRSYQQAIKEEAPMPTLAVPESSAMEQTGSAESGSNGDSGKENKKAPGGHNAVEQKYRRGINDSLIMLREIVPALGHLRAAPGTEQNKRKLSQFSLAASVTPAAPAAYVDGVPAPKKLSKQLILVTATDYIRYLKSRRDELEGEVASLKAALDDCVEDSSVVLNVHEERWAPARAKILEERQAIYTDREIAKANSKKRAKVERADGKAIAEAAKNSDDEDDSEEDEDEDDQMADAGVSTALPAQGQARARGGKATAAKKAASAPKAPRDRPRQQQHPAGPPKALMSVFAGASFIGGAGYDMIYGATGAQQANAETPRVWSQGLVKRSGVFDTMPANASQPALHPLQAFFVERPALLSGLVMVSLSLSTIYLLFSLLPAMWRSLRGVNVQHKRDEARSLLLAAGSSRVAASPKQERAAVASLAGASCSSLSQVIQLPRLVLFGTWCSVFGSTPAFFGEAADRVDLEQVASSVRLLELDMSGSSGLAYVSSLLHLYALVRSDWPQTAASLPLLARAEALLAWACASSSAGAARSAATRLWKSAQGRLKKASPPTVRPSWLPLALSMSLNEARAAVVVSDSSQTPLFSLARRQAEKVLLAAWTETFIDTIDATAPSAETEGGSATPKAGQSAVRSADTTIQVDELLAIMPSSTPISTHALLLKGVQAVGSNNVALALAIARAVAVYADQLKAARAFCALVDNRIVPSPGDSLWDSPVDKLAYATIAWLSVRQSAADSTKQTTAQASAAQEQTIEIRKLLATEPFIAVDASGAFVDAQERCIDALVATSRRLAGLEALEDSGCEL